MKRITPVKVLLHCVIPIYKKEKQNSSASKHGQHWHRQPSNLTPVKTHQELLRPSLNRAASLQPFLHYRTTPLRNHAVPAGTLRSGTRGVSVIPWEAQRFRSNFAKKTWGFPNFGASWSFWEDDGQNMGVQQRKLDAVNVYIYMIIYE